MTIEVICEVSSTKSNYSYSFCL